MNASRGPKMSFACILVFLWMLLAARAAIISKNDMHPISSSSSTNAAKMLELRGGSFLFFSQRKQRSIRSPQYHLAKNTSDCSVPGGPMRQEEEAAHMMDSILQERYACSRFERFQAINATDDVNQGTIPDPTVVQAANQALEVSRRAPSGFNLQPYKVILVSHPLQKTAMARHCCGRNQNRVLDSDCTAVFLADRQATRLFSAYYQMVNKANPQKWKAHKWRLRQTMFYMTLFSSGFPYLPKWISAPISWMIRLFMFLGQQILRSLYPLPTLASSDTWSQNNTMLVAMAYMMSCTARQVATCPMEGFDACGIRRALHIPRRYTIPLIVATGRPYHQRSKQQHGAEGFVTNKTDDTGMSHGPLGSSKATPRYPSEQVVFQNLFSQN